MRVLFRNWQLVCDHRYCVWLKCAQINYVYGWNSAWIEDFNIKPYMEFKDQFTKACKSRAFIEACQAIEAHMANPPPVSLKLDCWILF